MKKELWINMAKFVAILAVCVDHTNGVLYTRRSVAIASYFSVSLFVFLMGITIYWSYERNFGHLQGKIAKKIGEIVGAYMLATAIYQITAFRTFDFQQYIAFLIHFNASGPFYFILLYVQLVLASSFMFYAMKLIEKNAARKKIVMYTIYGGGYYL